LMVRERHKKRRGVGHPPILKSRFNANAQLLDFGSVALNAMKIALMLVHCGTLFGGG
jgi:hypothetical protein